MGVKKKSTNENLAEVFAKMHDKGCLGSNSQALKIAKRFNKALEDVL